MSETMSKSTLFLKWNVKPRNVKIPKTLGVAGKLEVGNIKQPIKKKAKEE